MRAAEGIVDIGIGERAEPRGQHRIVVGLPGLEADVLEHHDVAVHDVLEVGRERDVLAEQLRQARGHRPQRQRRLTIARPAEVGDEQHPRAALAQRDDRGQRETQAGVVGDLANGAHRHVELGAQQDAGAGEVAEVVERAQAAWHRRQAKP